MEMMLKTKIGDEIINISLPNPIIHLIHRLSLINGKSGFFHFRKIPFKPKEFSADKQNAL